VISVMEKNKHRMSLIIFARFGLSLLNDISVSIKDLPQPSFNEATTTTVPQFMGTTLPQGRTFVLLCLR